MKKIAKYCKTPYSNHLHPKLKYIKNQDII